MGKGESGNGGGPAAGIAPGPPTAEASQSWRGPGGHRPTRPGRPASREERRPHCHQSPRKPSGVGRSRRLAPAGLRKPSPRTRPLRSQRSTSRVAAGPQSPGPGLGQIRPDLDQPERPPPRPPVRPGSTTGHGARQGRRPSMPGGPEPRGGTQTGSGCGSTGGARRPPLVPPPRPIGGSRVLGLSATRAPRRVPRPETGRQASSPPAGRPALARRPARTATMPGWRRHRLPAH